MNERDIVRVAKLIEERDAALSPLPDRKACDRCGRQAGLDAVLADATWAAITAGTEWTWLCLWCIDTLCDEQGIVCSATLHFAGNAVAASSRSAADEEQIARLWDQVYRLRQELDEKACTFNLRWKADMRAIKMWRAATGRTLEWPDHADLVVWLLQQIRRRDRMIRNMFQLIRTVRRIW